MNVKKLIPPIYDINASMVVGSDNNLGLTKLKQIRDKNYKDIMNIIEQIKTKEVVENE
jgi:hypothetical protein